SYRGVDGFLGDLPVVLICRSSECHFVIVCNKRKAFVHARAAKQSTSRRGDRWIASLRSQ
ncbi:MAG: hypothetical protein PS018_13725, partial [bacterium]|nr:hypothetical protein [bacterium]